LIELHIAIRIVAAFFIFLSIIALNWKYGF